MDAATASANRLATFSACMPNWTGIYRLSYHVTGLTLLSISLSDGDGATKREGSPLPEVDWPAAAPRPSKEAGNQGKAPPPRSIKGWTETCSMVWARYRSRRENYRIKYERGNLETLKSINTAKEGLIGNLITFCLRSWPADSAVL